MPGFFSSPKPPQDISQEQLDNYIKSSFEDTVSQVVKKCEAYISGLAKMVDEFYNTIDRFSSMDEGPDEELAGVNSASFIRAQKLNYQKALANAVISLRLELEGVSANTGYERMRESHSIYTSFISKVLSTNANFKNVVFGYHSEISLFKRPFSNIEKRTKDLEYAIGKGDAHFRAYAQIYHVARNLHAHIEELNSIYWSVKHAGASQAGEQARLSDEVKLHEQKLAELKSELSSIESDIRSLKSEVEILLRPLERSARKFDHTVSKGREKMLAYITMPFDVQFSADSYANFADMLAHLRKALEKEGMRSAEDASVIRHLDEAINAGIDDKIAEVKSKAAALEELRLKIRDAERILEEYKSAAKKADAEAQKHIDLSKRKEQLATEIETEKSEIERMIKEEYGKAIRITVAAQAESADMI